MIFLTLFLFVHSAVHIRPLQQSDEPFLSEYGKGPFKVPDDVAKFYQKNAFMFTPQQNARNPAMWNENSYTYNPMTGVQFFPGMGCSPYGPCPGRDPRIRNPFAMLYPYINPFFGYWAEVLDLKSTQPIGTTNTQALGSLGDSENETPEMEEGAPPMQLQKFQYFQKPNELQLSKPHQFGGYSPYGGYRPGPMPYTPYQPPGAQDARNCLTSLGFTAADTLLQKYCSPLGKYRKALAVSGDCKSYGYGQNFYHQGAADNMALQYCQKQCRANPSCVGRCKVMASDDHVCKFLKNKAATNPASQSPFGGMGGGMGRGGGRPPYGGYGGGYGGYRRGGGPF